MHPENARSEISAAPSLVLLPSTPLSDATDVESHNTNFNLLGLGLVQRTVLAARRAGYGQTFFLQPDRAAPANATAIAGWSSLAVAVGSFQPAHLIIAPASI